jgi:hypothetical protein
MDPAIQALTIRPADWAALLGGFVEGLSYELELLVCIAALGAALFSILGRRGVAPAGLASGGRVIGETTDAARHVSSARGWQPQPSRSVVLVASGPFAVRWEQRQQRRARRRVSRRAAASFSFGPLPF